MKEKYDLIRLLNAKLIYSDITGRLVTFVPKITNKLRKEDGVFVDGCNVLENKRYYYTGNIECIYNGDISKIVCITNSGDILSVKEFYEKYGTFDKNLNKLYKNIDMLIADRNEDEYDFLELMNKKAIISDYSNELARFVKTDDLEIEKNGVVSDGFHMIDYNCNYDGNVSGMYCVLKNGDTYNLSRFYRYTGVFDRNCAFLAKIDKLIEDRDKLSDDYTGNFEEIVFIEASSEIIGSDIYKTDNSGFVIP